MPLVLPKVRADLEYFEQVVEGEEVIIVRDPVRNSFLKYNELQVAMLRSLDGVRTIDQMVEQLSEQFEVEIPRVAAERFIAHARKQMLLDVSSFRVHNEDAHAEVMKSLRKQGFDFRDPQTTKELGQRIVSAEGVLFMGGMRQLQAKFPAQALDYFSAVLELNPNNRRAKQLADTIQSSYIKALDKGSSERLMLPLFNPTKILNVLDRLFGRFVFSWVGAACLIVIIALAAYSYVVTSYPPLHVTLFDIVAVVILITVHDFLHEMSHGWACHHYGGEVREIGLMFLFAMPAPYCDTSSSYIFRDRRHQVAVQLAGSTASLLFTCSLCIFLGFFQSDFTLYTAAQIMVWYTAYLTFFNIVPFAKFDGYYATCDYFGIPNLRDRAFTLIKGIISVRLFGVATVEEELTPKKRQLFIWFGIASALFSVFWMYQAVFRVLGHVAEEFRGVGLIAASVVLAYLLRASLFVPVWNFGRFIVRERRRVFTVRRALVLTPLLSLVFLPWWIQTPVRIDADFTVVPNQRVEVRAAVPGIVRSVLVREGEVVTKGQPLAELRDLDLDLDIARREAELARVDAELASLRNGARSEEVRVASTRVSTAAAEASRSRQMALIAGRAASAGAGASEAAFSARADAADAQSMTVVAAKQLATVSAGARREDIATLVATRERIAVQLAAARTSHELLTIRSPIAGTVVTKHLEEKLTERLAVGDRFCEVHDLTALRAEISLPASAPLDEVAVGQRVLLASAAAPGTLIEATVERIRSDAKDTKGNAEDRNTIVTTSTFPSAVRGGNSGHARLYGTTRSLAYAKLYLPLQRLFRVNLWSML